MASIANYARNALGPDVVGIINDHVDTSMMPVINQELDETKIPRNAVTKSISLNKLLPVVNAIDPMLPPLDAMSGLLSINEQLDGQQEAFTENFPWNRRRLHNSEHEPHRHRRHNPHQHPRRHHYFPHLFGEHFTIDRAGISFSYVDIIVGALCVLLVWWFFYYGVRQKSRVALH